MRRFALPAALLALLVAAPAAAGDVQPREPLGHAGQFVTDADGRVVVLHGVAVVLGGSFTETGPELTPEKMGFRAADAKFLADHGFNVVRLGLFARGLMPSPGVIDEAYLESLVRTQRLLAAQGIFTILDAHQDQLAPEFAGRGFPSWFLRDGGLPNNRAQFPGGYFANPALNRAWDALWADEPAADGVGLQEHLARMWRHVAARFAGEPGVAGYDLLNEPWPGSRYATCALPTGCPPGGFDQTTLTAFSNRMIAAVRQGDPARTAYYEPNLMFDVGADTGHGKVDDPNAGMSFHDYCLAAAPGMPAAPDPVGACRQGGETLVLQNAVDHSAETGAALVLTEFGDSADPEIHERVATLADQFMVSWTDWAYMGSTGQIKLRNNDPPGPGNLRPGRLESVVRAYPRVIPGTPLGWAYDPEARTLEASWTTTLPDGRPAGDLFGEIFVPALQFPGGARLELDGAEVVGNAAGQHIRIRNCPGVTHVTVRVAPGEPVKPPGC